jgi:sirohydrochlorin cobaltochelatase
MNCHEPQSHRSGKLRKFCEELVLPETGVVVVGHGTANPIGAAETKNIVAQVDAILPNIPVELGYLEVVEPTIEMAVERLAARGCKKVVALPILLFAAGHAKQDVPQALQEAVARQGLSVTQADPLGLHKQVISLARRRFYEAIEGLAPIEGGSEALLVIGRGSSDPTASHQLWGFVRSTYSSMVRVAKHRFAISFVAAAKPTTSEAIDQLMLDINGRPPERRVVLHPHLLFHGHVENQVEKHLENMRSQFPSVEWVKVARLGAAPEVADALVDRGLRCLFGST